MPVIINSRLVNSIKHHLQKFNLDSPQSKRQFLINLAYEFNTEKILIDCLKSLNISPHHVKLLSSKDHELLFKNKLLKLRELKNLTLFQIRLIEQIPAELLSKEVIKLIPCNEGYRKLEDFLVSKAISSNEELLRYVYIGVGKLLIENRSETNLNNGYIPLCFAAKSNCVEVANILLAAGAEINVAMKDGSTPLYIAADNGHFEVLKFLLENGADPNKEGWKRFTPLQVAAFRGHTELVKLLLDKGADPSKEANDGRFPLHLAILGNHYKVVMLLLENGVDPNKYSLSIGSPPLHFALKYNHQNIVKLLLEKGADLKLIENLPDLSALLRSCRIADNIYNFDINALTNLVNNPAQFDDVAKARLAHKCQTQGLPQGFEDKIKNLPNLTDQQKKQIHNIFKSCGKSIEDAFEDFENDYCDLLCVTDPDNFPISVPYSLLVSHRSDKITIGEDESASKAFDNYNKNNFALRPDNIFNKIWNPDSYKDVIAMIPKDITTENYKRRIDIGRNILYSVEKLLVENPHQLTLIEFKQQLRKDLIYIEASIIRRLHLNAPLKPINLTENVEKLDNITSSTPVAAKNIGFVVRLNNAQSEQSRGI